MRVAILLAFSCYAPLISAWVLSVPRTLQQQQQQQTKFTTTSSSSLFNLAQELTLDGVEIRAPIEPVSNFLLVKLKDTLTATGGGILLPDQSQEKPTEGLVVAAGPGRIHPHTGVLIQNPIKAGMSVLYGKFDGQPVEYKGDECQVVRDDNVLLAYEGVSLRMDTVQCVRDYVLIEMENTEGNISTSSGVVIAAQVMADDVPCTGRVVKVGPGRATATGEYSKSPVQPGDYVKWKDYGGNDVRIEGKPYSVVKMVDILCTLKEE